MQLTHVFFSRSLPPIAQGGQMPIKMFAVGTACNQAYGGGVIASINQERNGTIVIRKDRPFVMKSPGKDVLFDFVAVFPGGEYAYGVDEKPGEQKAQAQQQVKGK